MPAHRPGPAQSLLALAALAFGAPARAEATLADLVFSLPGIVLQGIYQELARPWLLAGLWGAAALCLALRLVAGRDVVGAVMDRLASPRPPWIQTSSYAALAWLASAVLLYVLVGRAVWGPPQSPREAPSAHAAAHSRTGQPVILHTLPYPYGKSPDNREGSWPRSTGRLYGQPVLADGGDTLLSLGNPGGEGLWARLCAADAQPCVPLRQVYLAPRNGYTLDRVEKGRYRVLFTQTSGKNLSGSTGAFQVSGERRDSHHIDLTRFDTGP